jgi:hypothetical protein
MTNMTKDDCLKWLRWLFEMTKMTKVISWHGITNLIYLCVFIMTLLTFKLFWIIDESKMFPPSSWDSTLDLLFQVDIIGRLLVDTIIWSLNPQIWDFSFNDECSKWNLNPQLFWRHSKALTTKPSLHVMTINDITKDIKTFFEQKNAFKIFIIWFNWFGRFVITLNFNFL